MSLSLDDIPLARLAPRKRVESAPPATALSSASVCETKQRRSESGVSGVVTAESVKYPMPSKMNAKTIFLDDDCTANDVDDHQVINDDANFCEYSSRNNLSTRYDPSIVYAVDEILTRGSYLVLARWFHSYVNLPGCVVVVGYNHSSNHGYNAASRKSTGGVVDESVTRTIDLGDGGYAQVPYCVELGARVPDIRVQVLHWIPNRHDSYHITLESPSAYALVRRTNRDTSAR